MAAAALVRSVALLALPYEAQLEWLRGLGLGEPSIVDELADELGNQMLMLGGTGSWLPPAAVERVQELSAFLDARSGERNASFWTVAALEYDPAWEIVRQTAREFLYALT